MEYIIEIYDTWGRRIAAYDEVPLLDATRSAPDQADEVRGLLPEKLDRLGHAYRVRVLLDGTLFCEARVDQTSPQWSDTRKLILDRYVPFHQVVEFEAHGEQRAGNTTVSRAYTNRKISAIVKDLIDAAPGAIHYWIGHGAYPEGAQREYQKFLARKTDENELEVGGITEGQWVGSGRMDLSAAYAKDGDTIAGVVVDGEAWPDLRMLMIDAEETSRNSHAWKRHPEVAFWSDEAYAASDYKRKADAATVFLQNLMDTDGIDYIELNPHKNAAGEYDDRIDAYGRYIGLIYGGGKCFNAALVEQAHADVYLYQDGHYHVPEMALKDFFSYAGVHTDSVEETGGSLAQFDATAGVLEILTALAYAAGGYVFSVDPGFGVRFRNAERPDRVVFFDSLRLGVQWGSASMALWNILYFDGNPVIGAISKTYTRGESIDEYDYHARGFEYFSIQTESDADKLCAGLLDDLAYPERTGFIIFFGGRSDIEVGDLVELRGGAVQRLEPALDGEWGGCFEGQLVARIARVCHRFSGKHVTTTVYLTSPLRSVENPLGFITRSQPNASTLFEFRLDDVTVGLDMGFHLD